MIRRNPNTNASSIALSTRALTSLPRPSGLSAAANMTLCSSRSLRASDGRGICQEWLSTSHPPNTGPKAAVIAVKPDQVPMARPRWSSLNEALIMARLPGTSSAPPTPCTARAMMSSRRRSESAPHGCRREDSDTDGEDPTAPEPIPQRASQEQKGGEKERVRLHNPLKLRDRGFQLRLKDGESHADDRSVDEGHAGSEDGGRQHPESRGARTGRAIRSGPDDAFIAGGLEDVGHSNPQPGGARLGVTRRSRRLPRLGH